MPGTQTDKTTHSPPPMQIDLKMQDEGKNENRGKKRKKMYNIQLRKKGQGGFKGGEKFYSVEIDLTQKERGTKWTLIQREGQKKRLPEKLARQWIVL